jgi:hypothetical protein
MAGQSLVEFAVSSIVLVLLFGGLVDLTRAIHYADVLQSAAREGARSGSALSTASASNSGLDDHDIQLVVDAQLKAGGLPASQHMSGCPPVADLNLNHNPPYANSAFPTVGNQPWLYICYDNSSAFDYPTIPPNGYQGRDLNVTVLMAYGPMTAAVPTPLGNLLGLAANLHLRVQGG